MKRITILFALAAAILAAPSARADDPTPVKLSRLGRSIFFRGGSGTRGKAGFNSGDYSNLVFDGDTEFCTRQNTAGAELVIPTTGLDEDEQDTGVAWYVTEFKVWHAGNTKYSLYYTTEPEPADILTYAKDPRTWTPIDGGTDVQAAGEKVVAVNTVATAVKYVFDTVIGWTGSLAEIEVWGLHPDDVPCQHPSYTDWEAVPGSATCTAYGVERHKCTVCGETFERDSQLPLGHDWETHLTTAGSSSSYGSGALVCSRCGESINFSAPLDLTTLGGVAAPGLVQFADLSVSSSAPDGGGTGPDDLIDGNWTWGWGAYWFAASRSEDEYVQYDFGEEIDLTKIEYSAPNHALTLKFYLWDGENEEPLVEIPVAKDGTNNDYQRGSIEFRGVSAKGIRLHIADPTGIGYNGISPVGLSELHPWGTVKGAGLLDVRRTRILLY